MFQATDATSGPAGCTITTYSGPDDSTASLKGSCSDNAGNSSSRTISFKYDATPPDKAKLFVVPANGAIDINWAPPSDGDTYVLSRTPAIGGAAATVVYQGSAKDFVDRGLQNGTKYNYLLTVFDAAGNASTPSGISAVPDGSTLRPFLDTTVNNPPRLQLGARQEGPLLQPAALPGTQEDPQHLAEAGAPPARHALEVQRPPLPAHPGPLPLVRLAGSRRTKAPPLRRDGRFEHIPGR